jgi:uncharacterized protein YjiS (DUF1127 family)
MTAAQAEAGFVAEDPGRAPHARSPAAAAGAALRAIRRAALRILRARRARHERLSLLALDEHRLLDIGVTADVLAAAREHRARAQRLGDMERLGLPG